MRTAAFFLLAALPALCGDLTDRYQLTLHRVLAGQSPKLDEEFILADAAPRATRRFTNFSGDLSGRYLGALAVAAQHEGHGWPELDRALQGVLALQQPDGHFGAPMSTGRIVESDMATLWGNGRMLIGLLEVYSTNHRPEVLAGARKLGDFLVAIAPRLNTEEVRREFNGEKFAVGYICWPQTLEGIVELYRQTKDARYLDLARALATRVDRHPSQHSHGYLCSVRGVLDLYRVTGEARYLEQVQREWQALVESGNVLITGAVPEMFAPAIKRDEGCSEADWLRLNLDLWKQTRDTRYLHQAERTLFNEFALNQFATGDFGHHVLTPTGYAGPTARAWWCCTCHGLRALAVIFGSAFREQDGAAIYDLPVDGAIAIGDWALRANSLLGKDGSVEITVGKASAEPRTLKVRIPEWAASVKTSVASEQNGGVLAITRKWKAGERVRLTYELRTRMEKASNRAALFHGPWLLAVDEAHSSH